MLNVTVWTPQPICAKEAGILCTDLRQTLPETLAPRLRVQFQLDSEVAVSQPEDFRGKITVQTWHGRIDECLAALDPLVQSGWLIESDPHPNPYLPGAAPPDPN